MASVIVAQHPVTTLVVNPGADVYGSDLQMLESVTALVERGIRVMVLCPENGPLVQRLRSRGAVVKVESFPVVRRAYLSVRGLAALGVELTESFVAMARLVRHARPDVLYVNTITIPWWIVVGRLMGVPVVCHVHEAEERDNLWLLRVLNAPLLLANLVILNSRTTAAVVCGLVPRLRGRSTVVLNGVPDRPTPPVSIVATADVTRIAVVGRLSPRKAPHVAIEAVRLLRDEGRRVELEVAGTPFPGYEWYERRLRDMVNQYGLAKQVQFTGFVDPPHVVYDRADIVVAPSLGESLGNAVVEAQLAERPVVATDVGGHRETVSDGATGLLVAVEDHEQMADAIRRLMDDAALARRLGKQARRSALTKFSLNRYGREIVTALSLVMKRNPEHALRTTG